MTEKDILELQAKMDRIIALLEELLKELKHNSGATHRYMR